MKKLTCIVVLGLLAACGGQGMATSTEMVGAPELPENAIQSDVSTSLPIGSKLEATANVNLRTGPSTSYRIILVVPKGALVTTTGRTSPANGFYEVSYSGHTGYSYGYYYTLYSKPSGGGGGSARDNAIARARSGVGFSYHWGHGAWLPGSSSHGACYGSCPNCSHSGTWGSDCSGYAAKVWQVPSWNSTVSNDAHPYSTWNFYNQTTSWNNESRASVGKADAFVYNTNGAGHIFIYEAGDPWGSLWAYECKGCSYGCVHDLRSASSAYKPIHRSGY